MQRLSIVATLSALALCLSLAACGEDDDSVGTPEPDAGRDSRLGEARFDALDAVFKSAIALDELVDDDDVARLRADTQKFAQVCEELDPRDDLLAALRRGCPESVKFVDQASAIEDACQSVARCASAIADVRRTLARLQQYDRRSDRVVAATDITSDCREALTTPRERYAEYTNRPRRRSRRSSEVFAPARRPTSSKHNGCSSATTTTRRPPRGCSNGSAPAAPSH